MHIKEKKNGMIIYDNIKLSLRETLLALMTASGFIWIVTYVFYRSTVLSFILISLSFFCLRFFRNRKLLKIRKMLLLQFKSFLEFLSSNISVGKSLESSLPEIKKELILLHGTDSYIDRELSQMIFRLSINDTVLEIFDDFAVRSCIEDISNFVMVLKVFYRTGGNFSEIIKNACKIINDKIEIKQEISIHITAKKLESRIMSVMPFIIIIILSLSTGDFIEPLYTTVLGRLVMSAALIIIIFGNIIANKITEIEV